MVLSELPNYVENCFCVNLSSLDFVSISYNVNFVYIIAKLNLILNFLM